MGLMVIPYIDTNPLGNGYYTFAERKAEIEERAAAAISTGHLLALALIAFITVLADFDRDRVPDFWEVLYGMNTNDAADAALDLDGDLMSSRRVYSLKRR
mgnify:CR=1 FL=1